MKKILLSVFFLAVVINLSIAKEVKPEKAKNVAQNFYQQVDEIRSGTNLKLVYTSKTTITSNVKRTNSSQVPLYFVFNAKDDNGFIIVSGDDNAIPVLGYSTTGNYERNTLPPNFRKWLEGYKNQMRYIIANNLPATRQITAQWEKLENGQPINTGREANAVSPLISTKWGQRPYVNELCPYDEEAGSVSGYHCVAGCPATAMAQIMKYWNYPEKGSGFHSYNHSDYGTLSANFGSTTYDWDAMPNSVTSSNEAVATLMYHCGVAVEMQYGPNVSGSYVIMDGYPIEQTCEYAYKTYFDYDPSTLQGLYRSNYSDENWKQLLIDELDANRPVQYAGFGAGGHTFICDGYDNNEYFHMNWGWKGYADGYFTLDALNPGSSGTGSGAGTYNNGQQAVIGIQPPTTNSTYDLKLYASVEADPNPVSYGQSYTVNTVIANWGDNAFAGDYCAAIFDDNYNFVEFVEVLTENSLDSYYYSNGLDFTSSGTLTVLPGSYFIGIFYRPTGGDWMIVEDDGSYTNLISFEVNYSNDIELYQDIEISCGTDITQNESFTVTTDIANYGTSTFEGVFDVSLYNLDGSFVETIQTRTGAMLESGNYYDDVEFTTSGVNTDPGSYLLAVLHKRTGGDWELTGSSDYTNPIYVTIKKQSLAADMYEDNNSQNYAYNLPVNFSGNSASIETTGSNLHTGSDDDFYKLELPPGYNYTVTARAHDSYNSGNGETYTCDVSWLYHHGDNWSDTYDDVMPGNINIANGGTLYFWTSPYFIGQSGTYVMDIAITRESASGIEDASSTFFTVYPNPATDILFIDFENKTKVQALEIMDMTGKQIFIKKDLLMADNRLTVPVKKLPEGSYMITIQTNKETWQHKFIKSK